jgi:hypothetical protein
MYSELAEAWNDSLELLLFGFQISDENLNNVSPQPFPQSLPSELNTVDEISKEIYPSLMFGKKICNHSVSASLFRAVFDYKIIDKYSLRFRTDIRKAEDWCFFSDYLLHTSHIKLVDKVFYNYRVRRNSSITTYREPSALGLEKGLSILDYIKRNALQQPGLDLDVVNEYFNGRYNTLVLNYVKGLADKRSGFSLCTIYNKIDDIYQSESLRLQLSKNKTKFHISLHYLESLIVKRKLKGLMIAYTKAFYILKFIKNKAKS